ncbi:class I SAM-dependent methyltransferase [Spongiimicrobium salis]|uniref:class I SAM-dependent methyltransferase n=1 Tax=Spongiimicrobium salis TaxID=1667022 RepID=UPI00374D26E2
MGDIFGKALLDYQLGHYDQDILTFSSLEEEDNIPLPYLFRSYEEMPFLEQQALALCQGTVLDIGCGAGSHSLYLQEKGYEVTALDQSKGAVEVCKQRGLTNVVHSTVLTYSGKKFHTLLLLMNGIGLAGRLADLDSFLQHLKSLLLPGGQILLDSSDIIYMFDTDDDGGYWIPDTVDYYGEVIFTMEYKSEKSAPFPWLYLDFNTLQRAAIHNNLTCELVSQGNHYDYLTKITWKG